MAYAVVPTKCDVWGADGLGPVVLDLMLAYTAGQNWKLQSLLLVRTAFGPAFRGSLESWECLVYQNMRVTCIHSVPIRQAPREHLPLSECVPKSSRRCHV